MEWQIDNVYQKVYQCDSEDCFFYGTFFALGINSDMDEDEQISIINEDYLQS